MPELKDEYFVTIVLPNTNKGSIIENNNMLQIYMLICLDIGLLKSYNITKEDCIMTNIKPISELRNYTEVLNEVKEDSPVYLTRNGRGEYAIIRLDDLDKLKSTIKLLACLEEGQKSAREKGWLSADEVETSLGL